MRDWDVTCPDQIRLKSPNRSANASRRPRLDICTPPSPSYCVAAVSAFSCASCSATLLFTIEYPESSSPKYTLGWVMSGPPSATAGGMSLTRYSGWSPSCALPCAVSTA